MVMVKSRKNTLADIMSMARISRRDMDQLAKTKKALVDSISRKMLMLAYAYPETSRHPPMARTAWKEEIGQGEFKGDIQV